MTPSLSVYETDYTDIFITNENVNNKVRKISSHNLNLFTHISMKNDFLYFIIQQQIKEQNEHDIAIINQAISHAANLQDHTIYQFSNTSFFISSGDILYTFECQNIEVKALSKQQETCTAELAVHANDEIQYIQAVTHILTPNPTYIPCSTHFAPAYLSSNKNWYRQVPTLTKISPPKPQRSKDPIEYRSTEGEQYPPHIIAEFNNVMEFGWTKRATVNKLVFLSCSILSECPYTPKDMTTSYHQILRTAMKKLENFASIEEFLTYSYSQYSRYCLPLMQLAFTILMIKKTYELVVGVKTLRNNGSGLRESLINSIFSTKHMLETIESLESIETIETAATNAAS